MNFTHSKTHKLSRKTKRLSKPPLSTTDKADSASIDIDADTLDADKILHLQRTIGNQATARILQRENKPQSRFSNLKMVAPVNQTSIQREESGESARGHVIQRDGETSSSSGGLTAESMTGMMRGEIEMMHKASEVFEQDALKLMRNLTSEAPGATLLPGPVKTFERVMEKAKKKTRTTRDDGTSAMSLSSAMGVSGDIKDVLRCTLVFDEFPKLAKGYGKVAKALQAARSGIVVGIVKMDSWFGDGEEQSSGYRDAKIIFQVEPSIEAKKYLGRMVRSLPALSIEVQFNVRAALAVKDGKVHGEGEEDWDFDEAGGPLGHQFNAQGFLEKLLTMTAGDDRFATLNGEIETFMGEHQDELAEGLPIAHHLYEPEKVAKLSEATGMREDEISDQYNELYQRIYEFAYRASKFKLSSLVPGPDAEPGSEPERKEKATSGNGFQEAYESMKRRYVKK